MKRKKTQHFDEKQLLLRGNIFRRGFGALGVLIILNTLLRSWGVEWVNESYWQEFVIVMLISSITGCEMILRGVFYTKKDESSIKFIGIFSVIAWVLLIVMTFLGSPLIEDGKLSFSAVILITATTFGAQGICSLIWDSRRKNSEGISGKNTEESKT
jgi:hypothetical protein